MARYKQTRERRDNLQSLSYSRVSIPASSETDASEIINPSTSSDQIYYTFEEETYITVADNQANANSQILSDASRKKFFAREFGWWNKDEIPENNSIWAKAVADSATIVNLEHRKDKTS